MIQKKMKLRDMYEKGIRELEDANFPEAKSDIYLLLDGLFGYSMTDVMVHGDKEVSEEQICLYEDALSRRMQHIPVQHITGKQEFMGLSFHVNEHVLIPRQDTEILVEEVLKNLHDGFSILDMCTGSGCIILSLLHYSNECRGTAVDISENAIEVAKQNAQALQKEVTFIQSDLFENVTEKFDMIVSNPPYICSDVIPTLMEEVRLHEPMQALDGMKDGLFFYRKIVEESKSHLIRGGMLFFEIGYDQGVSVPELMKAAGYRDVAVVKDYAGLDRVVYGTLY